MSGSIGITPARRRIIVVDDPGTPPADRAVTDTQRVPPKPSEPFNRTATGYEAGQKLRASDGALYQVGVTGSFRRLNPKPLSKKARRRKSRRAVHV